MDEFSKAHHFSMKEDTLNFKRFIIQKVPLVYICRCTPNWNKGFSSCRLTRCTYAKVTQCLDECYGRFQLNQLTKAHSSIGDTELKPTDQ